MEIERKKRFSKSGIKNRWLLATYAINERPGFEPGIFLSGDPSPQLQLWLGRRDTEGGFPLADARRNCTLIRSATKIKSGNWRAALTTQVLSVVCRMYIECMSASFDNTPNQPITDTA
jgi:hypothetical protein